MIKTIIKTSEEFQNWFESEWRPVMSIDFECTSLDYLEMEFVGFSLCNGTAACYVDFTIKNVSYLFHDIIWVMHNSVFDLKCWKKFFHYENAIEDTQSLTAQAIFDCDSLEMSKTSLPEKIFCTLVGAKLIDENLDSYSLKTLAEIWLKIPLEQIKKWEEVSDNVNSSEFINYTMNDSIWTYQLYELEKEELRKQNLEYLFYEVEMPFQKVLMDLEINGILVDKDKLGDYRDECKEILFNIESDMLCIFGTTHSRSCGLFGQLYMDAPINFDSTPQLVCCIESLGLEITEKTKPSKTYPKGQKSVNKDTLKRLKGEHPFIDLLMRYRKLSTLYNTFLEPCESYMDSDDRIRPSYNLVRTGRLSCSKPNLHNQPNPKKEKLEFNYRKIFIPREGCVFVKGDWSGQELRNLAEVSKDVNMVRAFNNGYDLHLFTANRIFNLDLSDEALTDNTEAHTKAVKENKQKRHQAKNGVNFPTVYGAFAQKIAKDNGVSVKEAQKWLDEFDALYPGVKIAVNQTKKELERVGYVTTLMGRRRRFPLYKSVGKWEKARMERQAFNMKIQGFSADQMKIAAGKIAKILHRYDALVALMVHDEFVFELPEEQAQDFAKEIKSIMEGCVALSVPVLVDCSIVKNYGD